MRTLTIGTIDEYVRNGRMTHIQSLDNGCFYARIDMQPTIVIIKVE